MLPAVYFFLILSQLQRSISKVTYASLKWTEEPLNYVDYDLEYNDFYFDRIVPVVLTIPDNLTTDRVGTVISLAVIIDEARILTSYNPYREISQVEDMRKNIVASVLTGRNKSVKGFDYTTEYYNITCGRQVVFFPNEKISEDQWHGIEKKLSPLHDLMVLRMDSNFTKFSALKPNEYIYPATSSTKMVHAGPFKTELAATNERIHRAIKFVTCEKTTNEKIPRTYSLQMFEYDVDDNVIVDCDDFLPKHWGRFICLSNMNNLKSLSSGAMLISQNKVFGVGSFAITKGNRLGDNRKRQTHNTGVLVFTDIRPYHNLIMNTCTKEDVS